MRRSYHLHFSLLFLTLLLHHSLSVHSSPPLSVPRSAPSPPSSSSPSSSLLPSVTSLLTDLWNHPVAEDSVLSFAQRHLRFFLSTLVSPLQLLDFSHFNAPTVTTSTIQSAPYREDDEGWQHPTSAVIETEPSSSTFSSSSLEEEALRVQSDPSHALRLSVGAQRLAIADPVSSQRFDAPPSGQPDFNPLSVDPFAVGDISQSLPTSHCFYGQRILFAPHNSSEKERHLCWCPYDWRGSQCDQRVRYACPIRLIAPASSCNDIRTRPPSTSSLSHSKEETPYSLSPSSSSFFRYEPVLSGIPPPCLSIAGATTLSVNFTCQFQEDVKEGWGDVALYETTLANFTQVAVPQRFNYSVLVTNCSGAVLFAFSQNFTQIRFDVLQHNTAHPSQSALLQYTLNSTHLQYFPTTGTSAATVDWTMDPTLMDRNLKRGGRIVLHLYFGSQPTGLDSGPSLLPWRLYVEDSTFVLPGPTTKPLLTRFQWGVVVLLLLVVLALLGYRWYQRRQTAKFQALMAEQRGKQQSWFVASE